MAKGQSVEVFSWNFSAAPSKERVLFCLMEKSFICACGCGGRHTLDALIQVLAWSLNSLLTGTKKQHRGMTINHGQHKTNELAGTNVEMQISGFMPGWIRREAIGLSRKFYAILAGGTPKILVGSVWLPTKTETNRLRISGLLHHGGKLHILWHHSLLYRGRTKSFQAHCFQFQGLFWRCWPSTFYTLSTLA